MSLLPVNKVHDMKKNMQNYKQGSMVEAECWTEITHASDY